ncbi:unnamed protein product [Dovyalis caffra]|uniref:Uncharacterized protein n=1 Tax=Dovyalis caffra TaxID=77055 RepID=A0AAV1QVW8_9ROSI|nr:unnamed protein product [Dovyalis caffra]
MQIGMFDHVDDNELHCLVDDTPANSFVTNRYISFSIAVAAESAHFLTWLSLLMSCKAMFDQVDATILKWLSNSLILPCILF